MPPHFVLEGYQPAIEVPVAHPIMYVPSPMVNATPYAEEPVFHGDQSESVGVFDRMDGFQDQFQSMQKEIQVLTGK